MICSVDSTISQGVVFKREHECSLISKILRAVMTIFLTPFSCLRSQRKPSLDLKMRDLVHQESKERALLEIDSWNEYEESLVSLKQVEKESRNSAEQAARMRERVQIERFTAPTRVEWARGYVHELLDAEVARQGLTTVESFQIGSSPEVTAEQLLLRFMNSKA